MGNYKAAELRSGASSSEKEDIGYMPTNPMFKICHSERAIGPASPAARKSVRWTKRLKVKEQQSAATLDNEWKESVKQYLVMLKCLTRWLLLLSVNQIKGPASLQQGIAVAKGRE